MTKDLLDSYKQAEYHVDTFDNPIKIGLTNDAVENLLAETEIDSWCFITAWNPLSKELPLRENLERNDQLKKDLSNYTVFDGEGRDSNNEWQPEKSFLVLGISKNKAILLAQKYCQRAIVYGEKGKPAELIETMSDDNKPIN